MAKEKAEVTSEVEETAEVETPPETETQEDLQVQLDAAKAEAAQNLELYKDGQRKESKIAERERKQGILDTLPDILDRMNLQQAETWDEIQDLKTQRYGETETYTLPQRERRADQIKSQQEARKQASQTKEKVSTESQVDPEDLRASVLAQGIVEEMGWDMNHPSVKKTLHLDDPKEALKILRKEQKTQRDTEVEERYQQKLKDGGYTTPETAGPSAANRSWADIQQKYAEGLVSTTEYEEAAKKYGKNP